MSVLATLTLDSGVVECGGAVTGVAGWSGNTRHEQVGVVLRYWTQGRGDTDSGVAGRWFLGVDETGRVRFRLDVAPQGPVTYNGSLLRLRRLVQVIGVSGAGKSTTLRLWHAASPGPWHYVPRGIRRLRPLPVAPLVYWDEANRAPALLRRRRLRVAARRGATVVAGSHDDLAAEARSVGLAVDTVQLPAITVDELTTWAASRFAALDAGPQWTLPPVVAAHIAARAGMSWRVAGDLLHAWVATEVADRAVWRIRDRIRTIEE